jgi:transcriptional regulator with XRE-family HTH domain
VPKKRDHDLLREIGRRVARARRDRGWTQERLAEAIGIEAVTMSRWETGDRALSISTLADVARVLGVRLGDLLDADRPLPAPRHGAEQTELLRVFGRLPPARRELLLRLAHELATGR